ncbi:MAG TPA: hypothetical protein VKA76_00335 [Gammaproteobacteria bacterium]|nr:hypothetical protein [Gammaproteobacteria bacterium]
MSEPTIGKWVAQRELVQRSWCTGQRGLYQLFNDRYLSVAVSQFGLRPRSHWVDLGHVDPEPRRESRIAWSWFALAAVLSGGGLLLLAVLALSGRPLLSHPVFPGTLAALFGGVVALWAGLLGSGQRLVWHSASGRAPVAELRLCRSGRRQARAFVADMKERAVRARRQSGADAETRLSAELREHRRLRVEGVLDAETYEAAKERILELHGAAQRRRRTGDASTLRMVPDPDAIWAA